MSRPGRLLTAAACLALLSLGAAAPGLAQPFAPPPPAVPYPAMPDHSQLTLFKEFGGMWVMNNRISIEKYETIPQPLTPKYQALKELQIRNRATGIQVRTADAQCIPQGMPRQMDGNFEMVFRPDGIGIITGGGGLQMRNIFTDGRKHTDPDELFETFSGESIGHWEGDTLVVDTIGINDKSFIDDEGEAHSDKEHLTERYRKIDGGRQIELIMTVDDPVTLEHPYSYRRVYEWRPDIRPSEYVCEENNRNAPVNGVTVAK
jgi:hypothetical protein